MTSLGSGPSARLRWLAVSVFFFTSCLNYLDRQLLAALAPTLQHEFHLGLEQYGFILSAFSLTYAASSPLMGWWIDRLGFARGAALSVGLWSLAGTATGLVSNFPTLLACRAFLGFSEGGAIPSTSKANAAYLDPGERALGAAVNQVGLTLGSIAAPLIAAYALSTMNWRWAFVLTGLVGFLWIPVGLWTAHKVPPPPAQSSAAAVPLRDILRHRAFWLLMGTNVLAMVIYSLWSNWVTIFFVENNGLSPVEANRYFAWIPPLFAAAGGFAGGALAQRAIRGGVPVLPARLRVCTGCAVVLLLTAAAPWVGSALLAAAIISLSYACTLGMSVNIYSLPLDLFGAERAAFTTSALTASYGLLQTVISPGIGWLVRTHGFSTVCFLTALMPLAAVLLLRVALAERRS